MTTLAQMRTRIADDLNRTDLNDQIDEAINRAITYYQCRRTWFNETTDTLSTVASQQTYGTTDGLASDVEEIDSLTFTGSSTNIYPLTRRTIQYILDINTGGTTYTGQCSDWAWYQGKIYLYPVPDAAYTLTVYYKKSYSEITSAESNDWTDNAEDLVEARAMWWLYNRTLKHPQLAMVYKDMERDAWRYLQSRMVQAVSTGKLRATEF